MSNYLIKPIVTAIASASLIFISGCATLTGIPSHGGGKRFAEEQRLVSASIRGTLKSIDVSPLKGKKVAIIYDLVSDEGGGNISGGRFNLLAGLTSGYAVSPVTSTTGQFQVFNLAEVSSRYTNTATGSTASTSNTTNIIQNSNTTGNQSSYTSSSSVANTTSKDTTDSDSTNKSTTNIGATKSQSKANNTSKNTTDGYTTTVNNGSSTNSSVTDANTVTNRIGANTITNNNNGATTTFNNPTVTTTTKTGNVTTTQTTQENTATQVVSPSSSTQTSNEQVNKIENPEIKTTVTNSGSTNTTTIPTVTSNIEGSSNSTINTDASTNVTTGSSSLDSTVEGTRRTTQGSSSSTDTDTKSETKTTGKNTSEGKEISASNAETNGNETIKRETVSGSPKTTTTQTKGHEKRATISLQYQGLGTYENLAVPKSDSALLMGLVRNYLILNGALPTLPTDPQAEVILYVTVDVFGIIRSRFDAYVMNRESVIAETAIEMMAFDREGKMIMSPRNANHEAKYHENYLLWTGPYQSAEILRKGRGYITDFSDVDGSKPTYDAEVTNYKGTNNAQ